MCLPHLRGHAALHHTCPITPYLLALRRWCGATPTPHFPGPAILTRATMLWEPSFLKDKCPGKPQAPWPSVLLLGSTLVPPHSLSPFSLSWHKILCSPYPHTRSPPSRPSSPLTGHCIELVLVDVHAYTTMEGWGEPPQQSFYKV
jgi:hypothetical protein